MEKYCPKCFKKYPQSAERCEDDGSYLFDPGDKDLSGEMLDDRYRVLDRIGRGGMGVVYRAEQHMIKRIVALKVLRREIVQDEHAVKRFLREAQAIAALSCRYTITLHDFGVTKDGLLYYTMELLEGQPLSNLIEGGGAINPYRAARLILQTCESLKEAHDLGILHRDLKPDNLFLIKSDDLEEVRVLDFGIAKLLDDKSKEDMTSTGMIVGTPRYLSPEQALGNEVVPASDLYSLAIVLYEMLAGVPPFLAETPMKTMWAHIKDPLPGLRDKNPMAVVPKSLELFLGNALQKEPDDRYKSVTEFRDALRRALEQHDATPETVALGPLATTDEGLRVLTRAWDAKQATTGVGARAKTAVTPATTKPGPLTSEEEQAADALADTPVPGSTPAGAMTPLEMQDMGHAMTLLAPDMETLSEALEPEVQPEKKRAWPKVAMGVGGLLLICAVVLVVWQPWLGSSAPEKVDAPIPESAPLPSGPAASNAIEAQPGASAMPADVMEKAVAPVAEKPAADAKPAPEDVALEARAEVPAPPVEAPMSDVAPSKDVLSPEQEKAAAEKAQQLKAAEEEAKKKAEAEAQQKAEVAKLLAEARRQLRSGRYDSAMRRLKEAKRVGGSSSQIRKLMGDCEAGVLAQKVDALVGKAKASMKQKDYSAALATLGKALQLDPDSGKVKKLKAECAKLKKEEEAKAKEAKELEQLKFGDDKKPAEPKEKDELDQLKF